MFTPRSPSRAMRGQVPDDLAGQKSTSGGSSDSAVNAWHANPAGSPSCIPVITVTPEAK